MRLPFPFDRRAGADLLGDKDTLATVLHVIILTAYGEEVYGDPDAGTEEMDILELLARLEEDFSVSIPVENENRINAIRLAVTTDLFYESPEAMASIASAFYSGDILDVIEGALEQTTIPEVLWATYELDLNRDVSGEFTPRVNLYLDRLMDSERATADAGIDTLPEALPYHTQFVNSMKARLETQLATIGVKLPAAAGV